MFLQQAERQKNWFLQIFQKIGDNAYKIDFPADMNISSTSNTADIFKYYPPNEFSLANHKTWR